MLDQLLEPLKLGLAQDLHEQLDLSLHPAVFSAAQDQISVVMVMAFR